MGAAVAVGTVGADFFLRGPKLPGQDGLELESWAQLHAQPEGQVVLS